VSLGITTTGSSFFGRAVVAGVLALETGIALARLVVEAGAGLDRIVFSASTLLFALDTTGTTSSCSVSVTGSELGADSAIFLLRFVVAGAGLIDAMVAGFLTTVARVARLVGGALAAIPGSGCTAGAAGSTTGSGTASAATAAAAFRLRTVVAGFETFVARPLLLVGLVGGLIVSSASSSTGVAMGSSVSLAAATTGFLVVRLVVLAVAVFVDFVDFVVRGAGLRIDVLGIRTGTMMRPQQRDIPFCRGYCKLQARTRLAQDPASQQVPLRPTSSSDTSGAAPINLALKKLQFGFFF
jgi:hypothetical protein